MAEIAVTAVITVLCEKLISVDLMNLARSKRIDSKLNKWKVILPLIKSVLADASQKHMTVPGVQLWVNNLQNLAYDIQDALDDLATEAMRRKLNQEAHASTITRKVLKIIPTCCTNFTPRNIMYDQKMSSRLDEITTRLDDLFVLKNNLGLNMNVERSSIIERRLEENSLVDESKIMGREEDKMALLGKLLANEECDETTLAKAFGVLSIVGMGGIGKTTLAKVLYNEQEVKNHFEVKAWVCGCEEFDVLKISNAIFEVVSGENKRFSTLDPLHVALKEKLSKKRFLLVLDDVWNEDHSKWELLQSPLLAGAPGSRIIVTTRSTKVASVMDSAEIYGLQVLSDDDALSLFAQHALGEKSFEKHPTLELLGEGIVQKCGRLPLALKTLGRVLKGNTNSDDWEELLKSEIWDIKDESKILPALRLSYYHLPPHLKQLFAYCSFIPKDSHFEEKELVLLWLAEGFLSKSNGNKSMEQLGHEYFQDLKSRSFFQHSTENRLPHFFQHLGHVYTMHDLIIDLATSVAGEFSFRLEGEINVPYTNESFDKLRHFTLKGLESESCRKLKELQKAKRLRTLLLVSDGSEKDNSLDKILIELLPELQFLRVICVTDVNSCFQDYQIITNVPQSIGSLKHLRYLDFSCTGITCLPEQVSDLYNLQSLLVHNCYQLSSLPRNFTKLINLRHLSISDTPKVNKMPLGIRGLTSLQTLTKVIIDEENRFKISDLKGLSDLQGRLFIKGLNKVINPLEAKDANLHQKKGLDVLEMEWSDEFDESRDETIEYEVLKELRPHPKLKILKILFYKGTRFPSWVGDPSFDQLSELTICGSRSRHIPTFGHLRCLKKLVVEQMNEVKTVCFEFLAPTSSFPDTAFPSLEVLKFDDMQGWERWSFATRGDHGTPRSFPRLHEISIKRCPGLAQVSIGLIPSLRILHIEECSKAVLRSMVRLSSSIVELKMVNVKGLTKLHREDLMHLGAFEDLYIIKCDELRYLWEQELEACKSLVSLRMLKVKSCKNLVSSAENEGNFGFSMQSLKQVLFYLCDTLESYSCPNTVEDLVIQYCDSITSLTFSAAVSLSLSESIVSDCDNLQPMSRLTSLLILDCKNLKSIPHEHFQSLTSLDELRIQGCPNMDHSFPCGLWPPNLRKLTIGFLNKPMSKWGPQNFPTSLIELWLDGENSGMVSFTVTDDVRNTTITTPSSSSSFILPPFLVYLTLKGFNDVESFSEVLQHLPCLERLSVLSCPKIRDLKTTYDPSNLTIVVTN